jgi:hypothetical protein
MEFKRSRKSVWEERRGTLDLVEERETAEKKYFPERKRRPEASNRRGVELRYTSFFVGF